MTQEELQRLVAEWNAKVDVAAQNLVELQALPAFQRLTGGGGAAPHLTGVTAARVTPALEAMDELGRCFALLTEVVQQAKAQMADMPRLFGAESKLREIEQLLTGPSIQLPPVQTPLARRELCGPSSTPQGTTPARLLAVMNQAFQVARDAVLSVDQAWQHLEWDVTSLEAEARTLERKTGPLASLNVALERLAAFRSRIDSDPLGVTDDMKREVEPLLAQVRLTVDQAECKRVALQNGLNAARVMLQRLSALASEGEEACRAAKEKIVRNSFDEPVSVDRVAALDHWLASLESRFDAAPAEAIEIGLRNWNAQAGPLLDQAERCLKGNRGLLELRNELRGRLSAMKAKALGKGFAEDMRLTELADQTQQALYQRPCDLGRAADLLSQYERRLNGRN